MTAMTVIKTDLPNVGSSPLVAARGAEPERTAVPSDVGMAGRVIGAYTVERELGQGGMGSVWLARRSDGRSEGHAAIKFLNAGLVSHRDRDRFARDGNFLARLAHPNIAHLLDAGITADGAQPYLVLEYIDGLPIKRYCEQHALGLAARVRLFLDVLAAVVHAHNRLILHRDLKPSNILVTVTVTVTVTGEVKLLDFDFGIAKLLDDATGSTVATELTQIGGQAFTLQYAAPEQLQGGDVTTATDVYGRHAALCGARWRAPDGGRHDRSARPDARVNRDRAQAPVGRRAARRQRRVGGGQAQALTGTARRPRQHRRESAEEVAR